jgi:ferrochelatase
LLAERVAAATAEIDTPDPHVVFTAHSLPTAIVEQGDPYPEQLEATAKAVAERIGLKHWSTAWQSASGKKSDWLGPDILDALADVASRSIQEVVVCPCGFVADHLEVLYDIDIEAQERARDLGLRLIRTASPNADPAFIRVLVDVAEKALARSA